MIEFKRRQLAGANCELSVVEMGDPAKPALLLLHGTHDHALGMVPAVANLLQDFHVFGVDLRGHGRSEKPGNYSIFVMVADLRAVITALDLQEVVLVAHSLSGHIAIRYAAAYPRQITRLVLMDAMGPPRPQRELGGRQLAASLRRAVDSALDTRSRVRQLKDLAEAVERFQRNNPDLEPEFSRLIAKNAVEPHPDGGLRWCFDPAIDLIFLTYSELDTEQMASQVRCPVLLVGGELGLDFWRNLAPEVYNDEDWYEQELQRRQALFSDVQRVVIAGAGHMLHYDQAAAVQRELAKFLLPTSSLGTSR